MDIFLQHDPEKVLDLTAALLNAYLVPLAEALDLNTYGEYIFWTLKQEA